MYVLKRDGRKEPVKYDKITERINKLVYGLNPDFIDATSIAQKVIGGVYPGVTTSELDGGYRGKWFTRKEAAGGRVGGERVERERAVTSCSVFDGTGNSRKRPARAIFPRPPPNPGPTPLTPTELAAETAAYMSTLHPDFSKLAARISISNLHKNTLKSFSENVKVLRANVHPKTKEPAPLVSEAFYNTVMKHAEKLDSAIVYSRDFEYDYFGYKTLERSYLLRVNDKVGCGEGMGPSCWSRRDH